MAAAFLEILMGAQQGAAQKGLSIVRDTVVRVDTLYLRDTTWVLQEGGWSPGDIAAVMQFIAGVALVFLTFGLLKVGAATAKAGADAARAGEQSARAADATAHATRQSVAVLKQQVDIQTREAYHKVVDIARRATVFAHNFSSALVYQRFKQGLLAVAPLTDLDLSVLARADLNEAAHDQINRIYLGFEYLRTDFALVTSATVPQGVSEEAARRYRAEACEWLNGDIHAIARLLREVAEAGSPDALRVNIDEAEIANHNMSWREQPEFHHNKRKPISDKYESRIQSLMKQMKEDDDKARS